MVIRLAALWVSGAPLKIIALSSSKSQKKNKTKQNKTKQKNKNKNRKQLRKNHKSYK